MRTENNAAVAWYKRQGKSSTTLCVKWKIRKKKYKTVTQLKMYVKECTSAPAATTIQKLIHSLNLKLFRFCFEKNI